MNKDLFSNLVCRSSLRHLAVKEIDGVTWLVPFTDAGEKPINTIDLLSCSKEVILDFYKLGEMLDLCLSNKKNYSPLYLAEETIDLAHKIAKVKSGANFADLLPVFQDKTSPFLEEQPSQVIEEIKTFFEKYGIMRSTTISSHFIFSDLIHYVAESVFKCFNDEVLVDFCFPISFLAYYIYSLYLMYTDTERYEKLMDSNPPRYIQQVGSNYPKASFGISVSLTVTYTGGSRWVERKLLGNIFDLIVLMLFYNDEIRVRKCKYCGSIFINPLESAVYCSPSCRNRANSKKSYERRKARNLS